MLFAYSRIRFFLVFLLAGSLLYGCVSNTTAPTRFYVLNPLDPGVSLVSQTGQNSTLSVEVASLRLPQYLERPQIVTRSGQNRLDLAEYHQLGGNLRKNMMRVLAKNFSQLLGTPNVSISPYRPSIPPDFLVELEVMQFERDANGQVRLSTQWRLSRGEGGMPLTTRITDLESPALPAEPGFEKTVSAMSTLVGELSQIIGREILQHVNRRSDSSGGGK
jgi:uncharacterized lipoprotein YmbA